MSLRIAKHQAHYLPTRLAKHKARACLHCLHVFYTCQTQHSWQVPNDYVLEPPLNLDAVGDLVAKARLLGCSEEGDCRTASLAFSSFPQAGNALLREASVSQQPSRKKERALRPFLFAT